MKYPINNVFTDNKITALAFGKLVLNNIPIDIKKIIGVVK